MIDSSSCSRSDFVIGKGTQSAAQALEAALHSCCARRPTTINHRGVSFNKKTLLPRLISPFNGSSASSLALPTGAQGLARPGTSLHVQHARVHHATQTANVGAGILIRPGAAKERMDARCSAMPIPPSPRPAASLADDTATTTRKRTKRR